jgi:hypothetical protein
MSLYYGPRLARPARDEPAEDEGAVARADALALATGGRGGGREEGPAWPVV